MVVKWVECVLQGESMQFSDYPTMILGIEWWNGIVECVLQGERSLLMQFFIMVKQGPEGSELMK